MIVFDVYGKPEPGGSKTAFRGKHTGRIHVKDSNPHAKNWKATVCDYALAATNGNPPMTGALTAVCIFYLARPKGHYGSGKNEGVLKGSAPKFPTVKPDATKLWRSTEDALTGILWQDDAQIVSQYIFKHYADAARSPGARIKVYKTLEI